VCYFRSIGQFPHDEFRPTDTRSREGAGKLKGELVTRGIELHTLDALRPDDRSSEREEAANQKYSPEMV